MTYEATNIMASNPDQIYSATYSNVPVFEFVTVEGPIMRRKSDGWINATHILKIAKFPKAKRTRILEKDVQTGVHEKVQGGYGKYQGTYVPLDLGADIARMFGVYEILEPIFKFTYVEGKSETPPPAPKHNHASASNIARRQTSHKNSNEHLPASDIGPRKKSKTDDSHDEPLKKRGRPKRVPLQGRYKPELTSSQTVPISSQRGPSMGTFSSRQDSTISQLNPTFPSLTRQDTEKDALQIMASNLSIRNEDLELDTSADESARKNRAIKSFSSKDDGDDFLSGKELFGHDSFTGRDSFEKLLEMHRRNKQHPSFTSNRTLSMNGFTAPFNSLNHYHHSPTNIGLADKQTSIVHDEYFSALLNFFLHDDRSLLTEANAGQVFSDEILNPPQPLSDIKINQRVDEDGNTLLHWVCAMANASLLQFLVTKFAEQLDTGAKNYSGENPLMFMIKFNNSYQHQNFPEILHLLGGSVFLEDNKGQTVLHHVANTCKTMNHNPKDHGLRRLIERYANYYLENILSCSLDGKDPVSLEQGSKLSNFLNHQDQEGNTAFHLFAYHLSKKCIKTIIRYHKLLKLELRNAVNHTVEDYLASNNYILRIEEDNNEEIKVLDTFQYATESQEDMLGRSQSFESQLQNTKMAQGLQSSMSNTVSEKLSELAYAIDRELGTKDEKLLRLYKCLRKMNYEKFLSQKANLKIFKLDYLVEDMEKIFQSGKDINMKVDGDDLVIDASRDVIIQEEILRLLNDMSYQSLVVREELEKICEIYKDERERACLQRIKTLIEEFPTPLKEVLPKDRLSLTLELQNQIKKRKLLANRVYHLEGATPIITRGKDDYKENVIHAEDSRRTTVTEHDGVIFGIPQEDKLYKYCKLIALSCGMSFPEVEQSIDLIEESLLRNKR